jgi:hypothetical protein
MTDVSKLSPMERIAQLKALAKERAGSTEPKAEPKAEPKTTSIQALLQAAKAKSQEQTLVQEAKPKVVYTLPTGSEQLEADKPMLCDAVRSLTTALHEQEDGIAFWLDKVHEQLRVAPELVHMMTDEQLAALYQSVIKQSNVQIVAPAKAKAKAKAKVTAPTVQLDASDM